MSNKQRAESDSMGEVMVPLNALYGASTQRAVENFSVSGLRMPARFIHALGLVKSACARANVELGELEKPIGDLISTAATEIAEGSLDEHFPIDVFQTGSGTSTNMNANEVIANRCSQLSNEPLGSKRPVHPNDHANRCQSSNDVIPTTLHVSIALALKQQLAPALEIIETALAEKAELWADIVTIGRTHLMDATPVMLGDVFSGYARQMTKARQRCECSVASLNELAIGGTAVGTGLNANPKFGTTVCRILESDTGIPFIEAKNHFEAQSCRDDIVEVAGQLTALATALTKIGNDIRLLGTGPRAGFAELQLPATQPGSSIMPGKVNPVMCEMLVQASHYSIGLLQTVGRCGQDGHLQLNATLPLIAHCMLHSIECLANSAKTFTERCVRGLEPQRERCAHYAKNALALATALNPHIGYDQASKVAKKAYADGCSILDALKKLDIETTPELLSALDPKTIAQPINVR